MALRASCGGGNRSSSYATHQTDWREGCPRFEPPRTPLPNPPLPSRERGQRPAASAAPTGLVAAAHAARTAAPPGARGARGGNLLRKIGRAQVVTHFPNATSVIRFFSKKK